MTDIKTQRTKIELIRCSALVLMAFAAACGISLGMTYGMSHWKPDPPSMEYRNIQLLSCQAKCKADWMTP